MLVYTFVTGESTGEMDKLTAPFVLMIALTPKKLP